MQLLANVHIFVSACDAWCKWLAGSMQGTMATALQQRPPVAVIMDEMEHYSVEQVTAATAGQPSIRTLVLIGDVHQRLKVKNPKYHRTPWVSSADAWVEEGRASIELDDEGDGEDDKARGPSPGASSAASARELRNLAERFFSEWVDQCQGHRLTVCKRCGPKVTRFVSKMFDFASDFKSSGDQKTELWFVFYDGNGWSQTPFGYNAREKSKRRLDHLGWHHSLYGTLLLMCKMDLLWIQSNLDESRRTHPPVAIAVPLERVARPLAVLCNELFGDKVKVLTHHSIRGLSVNVVHGLRHRRWIDAEDQFAGVQEDPERDYMVATRGKDKTVMWLEVQPFGTPPKMARGHSPGIESPPGTGSPTEEQGQPGPQQAEPVRHACERGDREAADQVVRPGREQSHAKRQLGQDVRECVRPPHGLASGAVCQRCAVQVLGQDGVGRSRHAEGVGKDEAAVPRRERRAPGRRDRHQRCVGRGG